MRHFSHLDDATCMDLFALLPGEFDRFSPRRLQAHGLGATLYVPALRPNLTETVLSRAKCGVTSVVIDLEDSVPDTQVDEATGLLRGTLRKLACADPQSLPLVFVRPRTVHQALSLLAGDVSEVVTGIVIPKFEPSTAVNWLHSLAAMRRTTGKSVRVMPILESGILASPSNRGPWLQDVHAVLSEYPDSVLALRIGATDIAGAIGLRRPRELTVYDLAVVRESVAAIIGEFGSDSEIVPAIAACVWEHFPDGTRWSQPHLRRTIFDERGEGALRGALVTSGLDVLAEEVALDIANGLCGKSVIHPSHVPIVNSWHVVSHEEFVDAKAILSSQGAIASPYRNKMNETKPHRRWAQRVMERAAAFGVLNPTYSWVDLLAISLSDNTYRLAAWASA